MLRRLIVQRAKTAREGVQIAGELLNRFGYSDSGRTLTIADPNEAWLLSIVRGKHWVAQRVPDDEVALLPNVHIIPEIDLNDSSNFMGTPDIVDYAIKRGWFNPASGKPFSFRAAYNQSIRDGWDARQWQGQYLVTGGTIELPLEEQLPFSVKPDHKFTVEDVINILRYHGQGGTICGHQTQEAAVFQLRNWLLPQIGCIYWRTSAEPCSGVLIPWYLGITETPEIYYKPVDLNEHLTLSFHFNPPAGTFDYDPQFAWWAFKTLQDMVNNYQISTERARAVFDDFEASAFANQSVVEEEALRLFSKDNDLAKLYLTTYSKKLALQAVDMAIEMAKGNWEFVVSAELQDKGKATWSKVKQLGVSNQLPVDSYALPTTNSLFQNYPNPFNPETWIPYQLAKPAEVIIRIYNIKGQLIHTLNIGEKPAGFYMSKDRAAYWDGKDSSGKKVASGTYFYMLQVEPRLHRDKLREIPRIGIGEFLATQKMVIVK
jgi:dipeptidase